MRSIAHGFRATAACVVGGRVPLARRQLLSEPAKLAVSVPAIAAAVARNAARPAAAAATIELNDPTLHFCSRGCRAEYGGEVDTPLGYNLTKGMMDTKVYTVPEMHCGHCQAAVTEELEAVPGVEAVDVDLSSKLVTVRGAALDDQALRAAINAAGYEVPA